MVAMQITSRLDFAADPTTVYQMVTDPNWLEELCQQTTATSHSVEVAAGTTRLHLSLPTPKEASAFIGSTLNLTQTVEWADAAPDGSHSGRMNVEIPGLPVTLTGTALLAPGGRGTTVDYNGELEVKIPLVGNKIEQAAAPYIKQALDAQQSVGDQWLAALS